MSDELQDDLIPEEAPPSVGAMLKAAREAKGWSVPDAGSRLRLMARQIEAMEADNFSSLGQTVFARGFVRNYARLLGLDAESLLAQMSPASAPAAPQVESLPFEPKAGFWTSPWVMGSIVGMVLLIALPVTLYFWLNSGEKEESAEPQVEQLAPPPSPPPAPAVETSPDMQPEVQLGVPARTDMQPVPAPVPAPAVMLPAATSAVPAMPAVSAPPQAVPPAGTPLAAGAAVQSIQFKFAQPAWLQVRDGTGRMVHSALNLAGTTTEVSGVPPFALVVGNAANVQIAYKNKPVDIKPYIDVTVARFTLN